KEFNTFNTRKLINEIMFTDEDLKQYMKDFETFEIGTKEKFTSISTVSEIRSLKPGKFIDADYHKKVVIKPLSGLSPLAEFEHSLEHGRIIHKALSYINKKEDIPTALFRLINEGIITTSESEDVKKNLKEIININGVTEWFSDETEIKSEAEILTPEGKVLRPDRVM